MALLEILKFPNPRLKTKAELVAEIDDEIKRIVADMYETMYHVNGIGLAATQVGIAKRIFVMDVSDTRNQRYCAINPEILGIEGEQHDIEGCLSVEGAYDRVERPARIKLRALDINGKPFELEGKELMAACIQHEVDHLDGMLFVDRLSRLKQQRIRSKIEKLKRRA